jgi:hypothetical protein
MEKLLPRIKSEFDYVLRTNLSSFYVFPYLLAILENCPRKNFYFASEMGSLAGQSGIWGNYQSYGRLGSGCGFILSPDLVELLVTNKDHLINHSPEDDVIIGRLLTNYGQYLTRHPRMDFYSLPDWHNSQNKTPEGIFQFRIQTPQRLDDIYIHKQLLKIFYNVSI